MDETTTTLEPPSVTPLSLAREQIATRLTEALRVAQEDVTDDLSALRERVQDVLDRVDALELTRSLEETPTASPPASRLNVAVLATAQGEPVSEFLLIPFGEVTVERPTAGGSFLFTRRHADSAKQWFDRMARKLAIDYEHQSFERLNARADGLRPAAGWIGGLEVRDDGLWAVDVSWTQRARELLRSGEYRYFSPVIFWTDEDQLDVAALGPVALTNDPAMHGVRPLAASRQSELDDDASDEPATDSDPALVAQRELEAAQHEIERLQRSLAAQEADTFVERGMRMGKIVESTSVDWRHDYLRDPEGTSERLSRAPVLLPPGRVVALDRHGQASRLPREDPSPGPSAAGVESEDLAAFERAAAAGRVHGTGTSGLLADVMSH